MDTIRRSRPLGGQLLGSHPKNLSTKDFSVRGRFRGLLQCNDANTILELLHATRQLQVGVVLPNIGFRRAAPAYNKSPRICATSGWRPEVSHRHARWVFLCDADRVPKSLLPGLQTRASKHNKMLLLEFLDLLGGLAQAMAPSKYKAVVILLGKLADRTGLPIWHLTFGVEVPSARPRDDAGE